MSTSAPPTSATDSVLVASGPMPEGAQEVRGVDFDKFQGQDITVAEMVENMTHMGFQGSAVAEAARIINEMVRDVPSKRTFSMNIKAHRSISFHSEPSVILKPAKRLPFSWVTPPTSFPPVCATRSGTSSSISMSRLS